MQYGPRPYRLLVQACISLYWRSLAATRRVLAIPMLLPRHIGVHLQRQQLQLQQLLLQRQIVEVGVGVTQMCQAE